MNLKETFATELEMVTTELIERMILCDFDFEPLEDLENNYQLKDNTVSEQQLKALSKNIYRTVVRMLSKPIQEIKIEPEVKIPCELNKV